MTVLNSIELEGVSPDSWDDAARDAVREASRTLRQIMRLDVLSIGAGTNDEGGVEFRTTIRLFFQVEPHA